MDDPPVTTPESTARQETPCPQCGSTEVAVIPGPHPGGHHAREECAKCGRFTRWLPKPDSDRARRPASHRALVKKYGRGFCELCLLREGDLRGGEVLQAHHVDEFCSKGSSDRENVWIVCTCCHTLIGHQRTYRGHYAN